MSEPKTKVTTEILPAFLEKVTPQQKKKDISSNIKNQYISNGN